MRRSKLKFAAKPKKPKSKGPELVSLCDKCGHPLAVSRQRTVGSAICARCTGEFARFRDGEWKFYCCKACTP